LHMDNLEGLRCLECRDEMELQSHYLKNLFCSECAYTTFCGKAFANHAINRHSNYDRREDNPRLKVLDSLDRTMHCVCGYANVKGSAMASHLALCNKRSCYPTQKSAEEASVPASSLSMDYDNFPFTHLALGDTEENSNSEQASHDDMADMLIPEISMDEEKTSDDNPSMLNILGLMRNPTPRKKQDDSQSEETNVSANQSEDTNVPASQSEETNAPGNQSEETNVSANESEETNVPAKDSEETNVPADQEEEMDTQ